MPRSYPEFWLLHHQVSLLVYCTERLLGTRMYGLDETLGYVER